MDKKEFEDKLRKEFPNLYRDLNGNKYKSLLSFGINPGWYDLIYKLSGNLERLILLEPEAERSKYKAVQVKQKFGELRFYMASATDEMLLDIAKAEVDSRCICEKCGQAGQTIGAFYIYTSCYEHANLEDKFRFEEYQGENK